MHLPMLARGGPGRAIDDAPEGHLLLPGLVPLDRALGVAVTSPGGPRSPARRETVYSRLDSESGATLGLRRAEPGVVYLDQFLR